MHNTIRAAQPEDISAIQKIARAVWPVAYREILSPAQLDYMLELFYSEEALKEQMQVRGHRFFLALAQEEAIGFASISVNSGGIAHLHKLYVLPQCQGGGVGRHLLIQSEKEALSMDASEMQLNVNRHNAARKFYAAQGYRVLFEEDIEIGSRYFMNDYRMGKSLPSE